MKDEQNNRIKDICYIYWMNYWSGYYLHLFTYRAVNRQCFEETKLGDITIPKGMGFQFNMHSLHFNPELWGKYDPNKFVPERYRVHCSRRNWTFFIFKVPTSIVLFYSCRHP